MTPLKSSKTAITAAANMLFHTGDVIELRVHNANGGTATLSGYFNSTDALADAAVGIANAPGVYVVLNPVNPALLARSANRLRVIRKETLTGDADVIERRWLLVDIDPVRPSGISATDEEHQLALAKAHAIQNALDADGWSHPTVVDSGNGAHLLYPIRLPNNDESLNLLRRVLAALALRFDDDKVTVDTGVFNASRLVKVPGTLARKGDNLSERPHRLAAVVSSPASFTVVDANQLVELAAALPTPPTVRTPNRSSFDIEQWIADHGLVVVGPRPWNGGRKWTVPHCPWDENHSDNTAYIVQFASGAVQAGCLHKSCAGNDWHALRDMFEPGWRKQSVTGKVSAHYREEVWAERKLEFQTAAEMAATTSATVDWIARLWIAAACLTILSGKVKAAGKTTWALRMVAAVLDGLPFMGEPTVKTKVVYLTEQPPQSFREALKAAGLLDREDLSLLSWHRAVGFSWSDVVTAAVTECQRIGAKFLVVDTFPQCALLSGDAENNAGDALAAVRPLQHEAMAQGIAVLLIVHDRKGGGEVGDSGRGSSAFAGAADVVLSIRRPEGNHRPTMRRIEALSRFVETPPVIIVELTDHGYVVHGSDDDVAAQQAKSKVLESLPSSETSAMTLDELVENS